MVQLPSQETKLDHTQLNTLRLSNSFLGNGGHPVGYMYACVCISCKCHKPDHFLSDKRPGTSDLKAPKQRYPEDSESDDDTFVKKVFHLWFSLTMVNVVIMTTVGKGKRQSLHQ